MFHTIMWLHKEELKMDKRTEKKVEAVARKAADVRSFTRIN